MPALTAQTPFLTIDARAPEASQSLRDYAELIAQRKYLDPAPADQSQPHHKHHKHHILPKSMFPGFAKKRWNLVPLSLAEHFQAHFLLAQLMADEIATHRALYIMNKRYPAIKEGTTERDWAQLQESERLTNEAASRLQGKLRHEDWKMEAYRRRMSKIRTECNRRNWTDAEYRREQSARIAEGRAEKFYSDSERVARATAAQAEKTSGVLHWNFKPVNIYRHLTGELVASSVCLRQFCKEHRLNQGHMHATLAADRSRPSGRGNRTHAKCYFARPIDENGNVIGSINPAVQAADHHHARRADIFRASDSVCIARDVIISQFCRDNPLGQRFSQSALSRTAHADRSKKSSASNPHTHKGIYARYRCHKRKKR